MYKKFITALALASLTPALSFALYATGNANCICAISKNLANARGTVKAAIATPGQAIGPANYSVKLPAGSTVDQLKVGDIVKTHGMYHKILQVTTTQQGNYAFRLYNCGKSDKTCKNATQ